MAFLGKIYTFIAVVHLTVFENGVTADSKVIQTPISVLSAESRIIGGEPASPGEFPWQLQMRFIGFGHVCGAVLILSPISGRQLALTAAHCVTLGGTTDPMAENNFHIRAGGIDVNDGGQTLSVRRIFVHPDYSVLNPANGSKADIAILRLNGQFRLGRNVRPIRLPLPRQPTTGNVTVSGWGATNSTNLGQSASTLQKVALPVVDTSTCNKWYLQGREGTLVHPSNFCAGFENGGKNGCSGDSGGPATGMHPIFGRYLAGLVSWGNRVCETPKSPSVFTRVSSYMQWIMDVSLRMEFPFEL